MDFFDELVTFLELSQHPADIYNQRSYSPLNPINMKCQLHNTSIYALVHIMSNRNIPISQGLAIYACILLKSLIACI